MKTFIEFLYRRANLPVLAILTVVYMAFPAYFFKNAEAQMNQLSGKTIGVIDLTMGYNPDRTAAMLHAYSPEARAYYATTESTVDVVYPLVYAFFFAVILVLLYRKNRFGVPYWVVLLPFAAQLFDYIENVFIYKLLTQYPTLSDTHLMFCEVAKLAKWLTFFVIIGLILYGIVRNLGARFMKK